MIHDMGVCYFRGSAFQGACRWPCLFAGSPCNVLGHGYVNKTKFWMYIADLPSMIAALVSWVVPRSCSSILAFASAVYGTQVFCTCIPVIANGQGWMGHPALRTKAKTCDEALGALRKKGVDLSFLREDLPTGAFVSVIVIDKGTPLGAMKFPAPPPSVLAVKERCAEEWPTDFVPAHQSFRSQSLKHRLVIVHWYVEGGYTHDSVHVVKRGVAESNGILFDNVVVLTKGWVLDGVRVCIGHWLGHFKEY